MESTENVFSLADKDVKKLVPGSSQSVVKHWTGFPREARVSDEIK